MILAAFASRSFWSSMFNGKASISALAASRTWQIVTSGFFFRQTFRLAGQEQMTDLRDPQVPQHRGILSHREVAQAQFALLVLHPPRKLRLLLLQRCEALDDARA